MEDKSTLIVQLVIAVLTALPGIAAFISSLRNGRRTDVIEKKTEDIHVLVNSAHDATKRELDTAVGEVKALHTLLTTLATPAGPRPPASGD